MTISRRQLASNTAPAERLSADDQATQREAEFLAAAVAVQWQRAAAHRHVQGVCSNCGQRCLPLAVYCDDDCRADHERRLQVLQRQGRVR